MLAVSDHAMIGLTYLVVLGLYLLVSIAAVRSAIGYARKNGKSAKRWGWGAAFVMYMIPFWDWIPTVAIHQFYCANESGFTVYKTLDQWKADNPGVMETLVANKVSIQRVGDDDNHIDTQILNQRFNWVSEKYRPVLILPVHGWNSEIVDRGNGEVLARHVDFSSGDGTSTLKFWMNISNCSDGIKNRNALFSYAESLINMTDLTKRSAK